jgi:hypothetical protein
LRSEGNSGLSVASKLARRKRGTKIGVGFFWKNIITYALTIVRAGIYEVKKNIHNEGSNSKNKTWIKDSVSAFEVKTKLNAFLEPKSLVIALWFIQIQLN